MAGCLFAKAVTVSAIAALSVYDAAGAAQVRVNPDRPHVTDSPEAVPQGLLELDSGVTFLGDASGDRPLRQFATTSLLRVGLLENLEARIEGTPFVRQRSEGRGTSGLGDTKVGFKWHLVDDEGWRPALAVQPFVKPPTASRAKGLGSGRVDFAGFLLLGKDLPGGLGVEMNFGLAGVGLAEAPGGLFLQKTATASLTWALMDRIFPFWEVIYESRDRPAGRQSVGTQFGLSFLLHRRVMVDLAAQFRVAGAAPDWAVRSGLSLLLGPLRHGDTPSSARPSPSSAPASGDP